MKPTEILEHLIKFVEDPEEVDLLSREEVRIALAEEGIDPDALTARLKERLAQIKSDRDPSLIQAQDAETGIPLIIRNPDICPSDGKDHQWDGPWVETAFSGSATCSKCKKAAIAVDAGWMP